jgi:hypothetical protein
MRTRRRNKSWDSILVSGGQEENGPDFGQDLTPAFQSDASAFAEQIGGLHRISPRNALTSSAFCGPER